MKRIAEAHAWSLRMEGFGGPAQPSPTIGQCLSGIVSSLLVIIEQLEIELNRLWSIMMAQSKPSPPLRSAQDAGTRQVHYRR